MDSRGTLGLFRDEPEELPAFVPRLIDSCEAAVPSTASPLFRAIVAARQGLLARQRDDGSWRSDVPGDVTLASQMILLWSCLGRLPSDEADRVAARIVADQMDDGGWAIGPGDTVDLDASVLAYVALKLVGYEASTEPLQRARRAIRSAGGADRTGAMARFVLARLGQVQYDEIPKLSPALVMQLSALDLLPHRAQTLLIPLSIIWATRPRARVDEGFSVRELYIEHPRDWPKASWDLPEANPRTNGRIGHVLRWLVRRTKRSASGDRSEMASARQWLRDRLSAGDSLGTDLTRMVWGILALRASGIAEDAPEVCFLLQELAQLRVEDQDGIRFRERISTVGDTARVLASLEASGLGSGVAAIRRGREWLFSQELSIGCESTGCDSSNNVGEPSGSWTSDPAIVIDPDVVVTAAVVAACRAVPGTSDTDSRSLPPELLLVADARNESVTPATSNIDCRTQQQAILRARRGLCQMQQADGRWTADGRDSRTPLQTNNAKLSQSHGVDITGVVLAALGARGLRRGTPAADRAVDYLIRTQRADGGWADSRGRTTVGETWQALLGLASVGVSVESEAVRGAMNWLLARQRTDGSWDPTCDDDGVEIETKSRRCVVTSGVVLACVAAGQADHLVVAQGVEFLIDSQRGDGSWPDEPSVSNSLQPGGTTRHQGSALSLPLLALARYAAAASMPEECVDRNEPPALKLFVGESAIA